MRHKIRDSWTAKTVATEADRKVSDYRVEIREGFAKINADLVHITELLEASR
ncbi:MAG TPA: hypothetical protein VGX25_20420 [Actinophytocola sp.]|uniref:hypothetical protein n=1 Tax=Actinophytocola sp. TaxID=1872138 RepID=UPI002DDD87BF|nr:hypothetical protein [Actinophytocola sp.]HEV2781757.1 hypothetical protein [Actinophytocola sp.]